MKCKCLLKIYSLKIIGSLAVWSGFMEGGLSGSTKQKTWTAGQKYCQLEVGRIKFKIDCQEKKKPSVLKLSTVISHFV